MFRFLFALLVFDFLYSFAVGLILIGPALVLAALDARFGPTKSGSWISGLLGCTLCAIQGVIVAQAVEISLAADPARWDPLWWLIGFIFSVPIAQIKSLGDPLHAKNAWIAILASNVAYVCGLLKMFPSFQFIGAIAEVLAVS